MKKKYANFWPYGIWMVAFTIIPMLLIVYFAFTNKEYNFTFENIMRMGDYALVLGRSVLLAAIATVICLVLAYPFAYFMSRSRFRTQRTFMMLIMVPMWTSLLLRTYAWMTLLENNGLINRFIMSLGFDKLKMINTSGAVVLGMVYDFLPFMILPLYSVMVKIDPSVLEAANDLGAGTMQTLRKIILPLSVPGILSGITMVFVPAASTFVISRLLGGGNNVLIGDLIEMQFVGTTYNPHFGSALSLLLMIIIFIIMGITKLFDKDEMEGIV